MSDATYGLSACLAAALMFLGGPVAAAGSEGEVTAVNETVFIAARHIAAQPFDRVAAFTLTYAVLADGKMDESEKQLATVLAAEGSKGLKIKGPDDSVVAVPPPDAGAQHAFGLLISAKNMNEYWLKGDVPMTDMVTLAYLGDAAWARVAKFVASKFYAEWQNSSTDNGYKPIRDIIARAYEQGPDFRQDTLLGNAKSALLYDAMTMVDAHEQDKVPDFSYNWLGHEAAYRPFNRALLPP